MEDAPLSERPLEHELAARECHSRESRDHPVVGIDGRPSRPVEHDWEHWRRDVEEAVCLNTSHVYVPPRIDWPDRWPDANSFRATGQTIHPGLLAATAIQTLILAF